jgi:hypothetical protein
MIYVVMGHTGEHSDHEFWLAKAFRYRASADRFAAELNRWCAEHKSMHYRGIREQHCPLDPQFRSQYTGTDYEVIEVLEEGDFPWTPEAQ